MSTYDRDLHWRLMVAIATADSNAGAYHEHGRGFWFRSLDLVPDPSPDDLVWSYIAEGDLGELSDDPAEADLVQMMKDYDPQYQIVVVIEDNGVHVYRAALIPLDQSPLTQFAKEREQGA